MTAFGIDVGTTSVAGVAVDGAGRVCASVSFAHGADISGLPEGVDEQDPARLADAVARVRRELAARVGEPDAVGWTGQMHGVVGVDAEGCPVTNFVTWRDRRRFGGVVMRGWAREGRAVARCLPICALASGICAIDDTFLHAWYLDLVRDEVPAAWIPPRVDGCMLGDNAAGVLAAQAVLPGCAVVNLGTSAQLSFVRDVPFDGPAVPGPMAPDGSRTERRPYPGGRTLVCRASMSGGGVWSRLRSELGLDWDEMNTTDDPRVKACALRIADDLAGGVDLAGVTGLVGVGNALVRNPVLRAAVERRFGLPCRVPDIAEMAAYGAALRCAGIETVAPEGDGDREKRKGADA